MNPVAGVPHAGPGTASDTLYIDLIGLSAHTGSPNMFVSVDFLSDSLEGPGVSFPTPLVGGPGFTVFETNEAVNLTDILGTGLSVIAYSPGPVPGAGLLGLGFLMLAGVFAKGRGVMGLGRCGGGMA
jgi:hypothetical protein